MWDYDIEEDALADVLSGKVVTYSLDRDRLAARLFLSASWYRLLDCLGIAGLRELLTDRAIGLVRFKDIRDRLFFARERLNALP